MNGKFDKVISEIKNARNDIKADIIELLNKHNTTEIDCTEQDDCPIVFSGMGDDCMTLDKVVYYPQLNRVVFEGSGSCDNDYFELSNLDFEILIEIYDWLIFNEEFLFDDEE